MDVAVENRQRALPIDESQVAALAKAVVLLEKKQYDEVAIHFVTPGQISKIHLQFFQDASITDCISFPIDDPDEVGYRVLGEVFVCPRVAINYVKTAGGNPFEETSLYIVHGLLHLMGYDDLEEKERANMRKAEKRHMENLAKNGLILNTKTKP